MSGRNEDNPILGKHPSVSILARSDERAQSQSKATAITLWLFQSSPALMSGRNSIKAEGSEAFIVSILARSDERAQ